MKKKFNEEYIVAEYLKGRHTVDIANELGTYNTSIRRVLLRNNITLRTSYDYWKQRENSFKDYTDKTVQYWLGLLAADGNLSKSSNRVVLELQEKDAYLVKKFAKFTNSKVKQVYSKAFDCYECRCSFKDKDIHTTLSGYGVVPMKSKILEMKIPITFDFIRGVIDGDGSVGSQPNNRVKVTIATASTIFKQQIVNFLEDNNIHCTVYSNKSLHIIGVYSQDAILKLYHHLYNGSSLYLKRKKEKYGPLLKKFKKMQHPQIQGT